MQEGTGTGCFFLYIEILGILYFAQEKKNPERNKKRYLRETVVHYIEDPHLNETC